MTASNPLRSVGKPLFFQVGNPDALDIDIPSARRGETIRTHIRSLSVMQKEALVVSSRAGNIWRLASDEGAYLDGADEAPCPLAFVTTGMVCSYMHEIMALAKIRGIEIADIRLIQDNYYTMKGSALRGTMIGGAKDVELEAEIDSDAGHATLMQLVHDATVASPMNGLVRGRLESLFSLTHNDSEIPCGRVPQMSASSLSIADTTFDVAGPAFGDWSEQIQRDGMTPKTDETTGFAGSSLAEQQDRLLHVRGICTLRPDGMKHVEQQLFNPHGSIFRFLCDEASENGGMGRAPDASSYVSAGIGFCFMTQLGRYAKITKKDLRDYRIVQDTHFSLAGASGRTGWSGDADPVETYVFLQTGEDDEFARNALDMSEQTCFLHALCRTDLKTKIRIQAFGGGPA